MEIEIWACCYSEKADVSISFGTSVESLDGDLCYLDTEWIYCGIGEAFWENHVEFEAGIAQAKALLKNNSTMTLHQAMYAVFGDFEISYEIDGEETELNIDYDVNASMYALLET